MHREDGAQVGIGTGVLEAGEALVGVVLDVRLREPEVELARLDRVDVEHRPAGRLDRAADAVLRAVLVDEAADRAARGVVDAGDTPGADRDELLLGGRGGRERGSSEGDGCERRGDDAMAPHGILLLGWVGLADAIRYSVAIAASMAACRRSTARPSSSSLTMKGGARSRWSPRRPSIVPPMG